jgi:hydrogenase-4 component B
LYAPVEGIVGFAADWLSKVQSWTIRAYLTLVFATVVVLLMALAIWH